MNKIKMWKAPRPREYNPGPHDPGQRLTWTYDTPGHWTGESWGQGDWIAGETITREGTIWCTGQGNLSVWAIADDDPTGYVLVKLPGKRDREWGRGPVQANYGLAAPREMIRRAEHVRSCGGLFAVIQEERKTWTWSYTRTEVRYVLRWHTDQECPEAQGMKAAPSYERLTVREAVADLIGEPGRPYDPYNTKFCKRCVLLQEPDEDAASVAQ